MAVSPLPLVSMDPADRTFVLFTRAAGIAGITGVTVNQTPDPTVTLFCDKLTLHAPNTILFRMRGKQLFNPIGSGTPLQSGETVTLTVTVTVTGVDESTDVVFGIGDPPPNVRPRKPPKKKTAKTAAKSKKAAKKKTAKKASKKKAKKRA